MKMYRMNAVLSLILLVPKTLKIRGARVEAHFLKELVFIINKCVAQDVFFQNKEQYVQK